MSRKYALLNPIAQHHISFYLQPYKQQYKNLKANPYFELNLENNLHELFLQACQLRFPQIISG